MRNFFKKMKDKMNGLCVKAHCKTVAAREALANTEGEAYIDTAVKIIIGVVVGAVILGGLYALFKTTVLPKMDSKIGNMFDYTPAP